MSYKTANETLYTLLKGAGKYQFQGELKDDNAINVAGELVGVDASTGKIKSAASYTTVNSFLAEYCGVAAQEKPVLSSTNEASRERKIGVFDEAAVEFKLNTASAVKPFAMVTPVLSGGAILRDTVAITTDPTLAIGYVRQAYPLSTDKAATTSKVLVWIKGRKTNSYVFLDT